MNLISYATFVTETKRNSKNINNKKQTIMKTSKNNLDEQTVVDKGGNAHVEVNINTDNQQAPKKKGGFKRGAVVGTLGGIFLGGVGAAYAIENGVTMEDIEDGVNGFIEDAERGFNSVVNGDESDSKSEAAPAADDEQLVENLDIEINDPESQNLTHEDMVDAIKGAVGSEEPAEVVADDTLTHEEVLDGIHNAVDGGADVADEAELSVLETNFDDMSFDDAFAAARAEAGGPGGVFEWRGGLYGTFLADEWRDMPDAEKVEYNDKVTDIIREYDFDGDEPIVEPLDEVVAEEVVAEEITAEEVVAEEVAVEEPIIEPIDDESEPLEVEFVDSWNITDASGDEVNMAHMTVDDQDVALIDQDGDGEMDVMVFDENQDGVIDTADVFDIQGEGIMAEDINGLYNDGAADTMDVIDDGADIMA